MSKWNNLEGDRTERYLIYLFGKVNVEVPIALMFTGLVTSRSDFAFY